MLPIRLYILSLPCVWFCHNSIVWFISHCFWKRFSRSLFCAFRGHCAIAFAADEGKNGWLPYISRAHTVERGCCDCTKFSFYAKLWIEHIHSIYENLYASSAPGRGLNCQAELAKKSYNIQCFPAQRKGITPIWSIKYECGRRKVDSLSVIVTKAWLN